MKKLKMDELNRVSIEDYKLQKKIPLVIVLDNIRSLNNIGSAFRTADAFSVAAIYLCGITGTPPHKEIHKTALGATESVEWKYFENTSDAIDDLIAEGFLVYAIEQASGSIKLNDYKPDINNKTAFVFGNEVNGVEEKLFEKVNSVIEIPQFGTKHSLNISVSVGIVVWHYVLSIKKGTAE